MCVRFTKRELKLGNCAFIYSFGPGKNVSKPCSEFFEGPCCFCVLVLVNSPRLNREISRFWVGNLGQKREKNMLSWTDPE
jgi:hypothetical protein